MKAYMFPGQGSQFVGMGKNLYYGSSHAKGLFEAANDILGFRITDLMFSGTDADLQQTKVTQPAIFLHSVILTKSLSDFAPDMAAGHSLGEFSALAATGAMSFEDSLRLVIVRANAMQRACERQPSTMAAVLGLDDGRVEEICSSIVGIVVPANYNCPGQVVISGEISAVDVACKALKAAGAKHTLRLPVSGAFHSPLMGSAREELEAAIMNTAINSPICPVYQNVDAKPYTDPVAIRKNLIAQLTMPVYWTLILRNMIADGADTFEELGPGSVLQGFVKKIAPHVAADGKQ